jgi:hypothetical protein
MIKTKRTPAQTRREKVRAQFRAHAMQLAGVPAAQAERQVYDGHGRPRRKPHYINIIGMKA